jgi:DNA (cytosine-5)-methyltransferase 1
MVEKDPFCCQTLRCNAKYFPDAVVLRRDIRSTSVQRALNAVNLSPSDIDLIAAGPPCQSFSISKIPKGGRSPADPRDALLWDFVRFLKKVRPPMMLFENVPGLLSKSGGLIFDSFLSRLRRLGYRTTHRILDAADYGVPQHRRRLFVVGTLSGNCLEFPDQTHGPNSLDVKIQPYVTIGDTLSNLPRSAPNGRTPMVTTRKRTRLAGIIPGSEWKHWRHRDRWDGPSRCITAHCRDEWIHPLEPRLASVRELAALQTFPNDYEFCGPLNASNNSKKSFQYRQVGNSVPVQMAKAIGSRLVQQLIDP